MRRRLPREGSGGGCGESRGQRARHVLLLREDGGQGRSGAFLCPQGPDSAVEGAQPRAGSGCCPSVVGWESPRSSGFFLLKKLLQKHEVNTVRKCPGLEVILRSSLLSKCLLPLFKGILVVFSGNKYV